MCSAKPGDIALTVATGGLALPFIMQREQKKMIDSQNKAQSDAMNAQVQRDKNAKDQADAIGVAARKSTVDQVTADEEKRRQLALQNGIMGTIKSTTNTMAAAPTEIKKATLGA